MKIAKKNEQFFNLLEDLFTRINGTVAAAALNQVVNNHIVYFAGASCSNKGLQRREYSMDQYIYSSVIRMTNMYNIYIYMIVYGKYYYSS